MSNVIKINGYDVRDTKAVHYNGADGMTDAQKKQARANIGAVSEANFGALADAAHGLADNMPTAAVSTTWAKGMISAATGLEAEATNRVRSNFVNGARLDRKIHADEGYKFAVRCYDSGYIFISVASPQWYTGEVWLHELVAGALEKPDTAYVRIVGAKTGDGTITEAEVAAVAGHIHITDVGSVPEAVAAADARAQAEEQRLRGEVERVEDAIYAATFAAGTISTTDGVVDPTVANRIRTYKIALSDLNRVEAADGVKFSARNYSAADVYLGTTAMLTGSHAADELSVNADTAIIRLVVGYTSDSDVEEIDALAAQVTIYRQMGFSALEAMREGLYVYEPIYPTWTHGNLNATTHLLTEDRNRINTGYIPVADGVRVSVDAGYKYTLHYFDANGTPLGGAAWITGDSEIHAPSRFIRLSAAADVEGTAPDIADPAAFGRHVHVSRLGRAEVVETEMTAFPNNPDADAGQLMPEYMVLEYVREQHRAGELDRTVGYLYRTTSAPYKFYYADGRPENLRYLFTWDETKANDGTATPIRYAFCMTEEGDVIAVWRGEIAVNDYRDQPIVYARSTGYTAKRMALTGPLPTAWLENVGVYVEAGCVWFGEYTRPYHENAYIWKVEAPYTEAANWTISRTYALDPTPEVISSLVPGRIEHIHHISRDPWSGVLYCTTGDHHTEARIDYFDETNGVWVPLLAGNERLCRQLNFIWTASHVYWASDAWRYWDPDVGDWVRDEHNFFRATRDANGLIDLASVEAFKIPDLAESVVTYHICYIEDKECILILDRHDTRAAVFEIPFRVFDLRDGALKLAGSFKQVEGGNLMLGFRPECCQHYPGLYDSEMRLGFALYPNTLDVCGNPLPTLSDVTGWTRLDSANLAQVNNLTLKVERKKI